MALAAALGTLLQGATVPRYRLLVNGVDRLASTPLDSVRVTHATAGAVSEMELRVEDPTSAISISEGQIASLYDVTRDEPMFYGYVARMAIVPFGVGRAYELVCYGWEQVLDLVRTGYALSWDPAGTTFQVWAMVQSILSAGAWTFNADLHWGSLGSFDAHSYVYAPLSWSELDFFSSGDPVVTVPAGTTLRAAINMVLAASQAAHPGYGAAVTIDPDRSVRMWSMRVPLSGDYGQLTVLDTVASPLASEHSRWQAISAGPYQPQSDRYATGSMELTDMLVPGARVWPGGTLSYTAANLGIASAYPLGQITKTINASGRQNWQVNYGLINTSYVDSA